MSTPRPPVLVGLIIADLDSSLEVAAVVAGFVGAVGLGVAVFIWARNWRRRLAEEPTTEETIETYQQMLDEGLIDSQEFGRIQARLRQPSDLAAGASDAPRAGARSEQPPRATDFRAGPPAAQPPSE